AGSVTTGTSGRGFAGHALARDSAGAAASSAARHRASGGERPERSDLSAGSISRVAGGTLDALPVPSGPALLAPAGGLDPSRRKSNDTPASAPDQAPSTKSPPPTGPP